MRFQHDCLNCVPLGEYCHADLYACVRNGKASTVIARFSSETGDYQSGIPFSYDAIPELTEARVRAEAKGIIVSDL